METIVFTAVILALKCPTSDYIDREQSQLTEWALLYSAEPSIMYCYLRFVPHLLWQ